VVPGLAVSVVAIAALGWVVDLDGMAAAFEAVRPGPLLPVLPIYVASLLCRALAWRTLLAGRATLVQTFFVLNQGYLVHNLLPLRLGEVARCFLLARVAGLRFFAVVPTVTIERLFDVVLAVSLLLATTPLVWGAESSRALASAVGGGVALALVVLVLMARHHRELTAAVNRWRRLPGAVRRVIGDILGGLAVLANPWRALLAFGWLALGWGLAIVVCWLMLRAFVPAGGLLHAAFGLGVMAMGVAIPSSPANIGVYEAAWVGALTLCGFDQEPALAFALTSHLLMVATTASFAVWGFMRQGTSLQAVFREIRLGRWRRRDAT
jgi:uncharacterized membrane protein YbhN (UPF0104 family)